MPDRPYDLVLFGATGVTGRLAAQALRRRAPPGLRWALAGRDAGRLEAVRAALCAEGGPEVPVLLADAQDPAAVEALVAQTHGVLTTAGPYARYGSALLGACARQGVDYNDITGETPWVQRMIAAHHDEARASGARIVPFCGFDSVPGDLGTLLLARRMREQHSQALARVRVGYAARGGVNGGTLASMYRMMDDGGVPVLREPYSLNPPGAVPPGPPPPDQLDARYDEDLGAWTAPFVMQFINARVVRRSAALYAQAGQPYGEAVYSECLRVSGPAPGLVAMGLAAGTLGAALALQVPALRRLAERVGPAPGQTTGDPGQEPGFTRVLLVGVGEQGARLRLRLSYPGDPGNAFTTTALVECALALRLERERLPPLGGGVLTPATAIGEVLAERLGAAGVLLEWLDAA